jgi:N6-L-threonylcarbamoyladenine synthase
MKNSPDFNFSFSGLKTASLYRRQELGKMSRQQIADFCASFERVAIEGLAIKLVAACRHFKPRMILLGGGVLASTRLQERISKETDRLGIPCHLPYRREFLTDNAGMIAVAASFKAKRGEFVANLDEVDRVPNLSLS